MAAVYGTILVALGCWSTYATLRTLTSRGGWRRHRVLVAVEIVFIASCFLPAIALLTDAFDPWMLLPLGACYFALITLPCYFPWADRGRFRPARNLLFLVVGLVLVAVGLRWIPRGWFGL